VETNLHSQAYAYAYVEDNDKHIACNLCKAMLQNKDIHLYYQVKCHLMLAALAEIRSVEKLHLD
jgi:hypothetical protein